jgi:hypothetical protein
MDPSVLFQAIILKYSFLTQMNELKLKIEHPTFLYIEAPLADLEPTVKYSNGRANLYWTIRWGKDRRRKH